MSELQEAEKDVNWVYFSDIGIMRAFFPKKDKGGLGGIWTRGFRLAKAAIIPD